MMWPKEFSSADTKVKKYKWFKVLNEQKLKIMQSDSEYVLLQCVHYLFIQGVIIKQFSSVVNFVMLNENKNLSMQRKQ